LGGILVLFVYVTSLASNEIFIFSIKIISILLLILMIKAKVLYEIIKLDVLDITLQLSLKHLLQHSHAELMNICIN